MCRVFVSYLKVKYSFQIEFYFIVLSSQLRKQAMVEVESQQSSLLEHALKLKKRTQGERKNTQLPIRFDTSTVINLGNLMRKFSRR